MLLSNHILGTRFAQILIHDLISILYRCRILLANLVRWPICRLVWRFFLYRVKLDADCQLWRLLSCILKVHADLFVQCLSLDVSPNDWQGVLVAHVDARLLLWSWVIQEHLIWMPWFSIFLIFWSIWSRRYTFDRWFLLLAPTFDVWDLTLWRYTLLVMLVSASTIDNLFNLFLLSTWF